MRALARWPAAMFSLDADRQYMCGAQFALLDIGNAGPLRQLLDMPVDPRLPDHVRVLVDLADLSVTFIDPAAVSPAAR